MEQKTQNHPPFPWFRAFQLPADIPCLSHPWLWNLSSSSSPNHCCLLWRWSLEVCSSALGASTTLSKFLPNWLVSRLGTGSTGSCKINLKLEGFRKQTRLERNEFNLLTYLRLATESVHWWVSLTKWQRTKASLLNGRWGRTKEITVSQPSA